MRNASKLRAALPDDTRSRLLDTAERMFATTGFSGVSLRAVVGEAGVNLAAIHYHFGSKFELIEAVVLRHAEAIISRRMELLAACREEPGRPDLVTQIIEAFLIPAFDTEGDTDYATYTKLRARLAVESGDLAGRILSKGFDESSRAFIDALKKALPEQSETDVYWRFHMLLGTMVYTTLDTGRIRSLSGGRVDTGDLKAALPQLVHLLSAAFRAPLSPGSP